MSFSRRPDPRFNRGRIATVAGTSTPPDFTDLVFRIDALNPATYTESAGALTSLISTVSGTPLSTITGTPTFITDPRDNKPAFAFAGLGYVRGADATYIAAVAGTDKPFTSIAVIEVGDVTSNRCIDSVKNTLNAGNGQEFLASAGRWYYERDGAPSGPARLAFSETIQAGLTVLVQHSADGLTVKSSQNGGAETTAAAFLSAGAVTPDIVGIGVQTGSSNTFLFDGVIRERLYYSTDKTPAQIASIVNYLLAKWRPPPVAYFIGDSITAASLATNGGMVRQLVVAARADGLNLDPQGPFILPNGSGGEVHFPFRCSAVSGNTCAQMNTRVISTTQGLGKGGASLGYYQRTRIAFIFAGTNGAVSADYDTLLNNTYTQMLQHGLPDFRIVVTPITDINGSTAVVTAYNAAIAAIWSAFEAAHPGILIYWDAFNAAPWNGTDYVDSTHPSSSGYLKLVNDPTYGLYQAVKPYLQSIQ